ncbi:MAG: hypothetical protein ING61_08105 [Rhodocyclaceae bacterium]|nr:hypothetical protein [Rhodocyclaceae bacterium]
MAVSSLAVACLSSNAQAMSFHAAPPLLYLGGGVVPEDWNTWEEAMIRFDGQLTTIVLHDSGGGDSTAGRKIGLDIRKRGFNSIVSGRCSSACANMFLAGVDRQYAAADKNRRHVLGYHGSYNKVTKELNRNRAGDYFIEMTNGKMGEDFVDRFIKLENRSGLMRFFHRHQRLQYDDPSVQLCKGSEERAKRDEQCEHLPDIDALSVGVVTSWNTTSIPPPPTPTREKKTVASWW